MDPRRGILAALFAATLAVVAPVAASPLPGDAAVEFAAVEFEGSVADAPIVIESIDPERNTADPELVERMLAIEADLTSTNNAPALGLPQGAAAQTGGFVAQFDANVPTDVRGAINAAVGQWGEALNTPLPVVVSVSWVCLGDPGILGYAGASQIYQLAELPTSFGYPNALANALTGRDLNGSEPEVRVVLNAELAAANNCSFASDSWHTGLATPPATKVDMVSVVLHEVAHGLGFLGSAWRKPGSNQPTLEPTPYAYDSFVHSSTGRLLDHPDPNSQLTQQLSIDIGGGNLFGLFSPPMFINGSSFSHFSVQATASDRGGALMTAELGSGTVQRTIDAAVIGVLAQQGWVPTGAPVTPSLGVTTGRNGVTVAIDPRLDQAGAAPTHFEVTAVRDGTIDATVIVPAGQFTVDLGPLYNGVVYDIRVTPLGPSVASGSRVTGIPATASATMPNDPNQPLQVAAGGSGLARTITWELPIAAQNDDVYLIEQRLVGGAWTMLGQTTSTSFDSGPLASGVHQFRVTAVRDGRRGLSGASLLIGVSDGLIRPLPLDGEVGRLFSAYFLRQPDRAGYDYWIQERAEGTELASISSSFASSREFTDRYGALDDRAFVDLIYRNVLGRAADQTGLDYWVGELRAGRDRGQVMAGFSESPEYVTRTATARSTSSSEGQISRLYFAFFLREPDPAGLDFWMTAKRRGLPLAQIAVEMAKSDEFVGTYGNIPDTRFVDLVYNNVLTRTPDAAGRAHWLGQLGNGLDRGTMMSGFSESKEFIIRTGTLP